MKLKDAVTAARIRKGPAADITTLGEFWLMPAPPLIGSHGADGVGTNAADRRSYLHLRHYRSGQVEAVVCIESWHQNYGESHEVVGVSAILEAETTADVIRGLKTAEAEAEYQFFSACHTDRLTDWLGSLGIPAATPGPDEVLP